MLVADCELRVLVDPVKVLFVKTGDIRLRVSRCGTLLDQVLLQELLNSLLSAHLLQLYIELRQLLEVLALLSQSSLLLLLVIPLPLCLFLFGLIL